MHENETHSTSHQTTRRCALHSRSSFMFALSSGRGQSIEMYHHCYFVGRSKTTLFLVVFYDRYHLGYALEDLNFENH